MLATACGGSSSPEAETDASSSDSGSSTPTSDPSPADSSSGGDDGPEPSCGDCSATPEILWQTTWGAGVWESAFAAATNTSGQIALTGPVDWPPTGGFVALYDVDGALVFNDMLAESGAGLVWLDETSFAIAGTVPGTGEVALSGRDNTGAVLWTSAERPVAEVGGLARTDGGDLVVAGGAPTTGYIGRFDAMGVLKTTTATPIDLFLKDVATRGDGVAVVGQGADQRIWVGAYDGSDTLAWSQPGPDTRSEAVIVTADGTVITAITTTSGGSTLLRNDTDGTALPAIDLPWASSLVTDMLALDDGDVILATSVVEGGVPHCSLSRLNPAGTLTWGVSFASIPEISECVSVDVGPDGTLLAAGGLNDALGDGDAWIFRIAAE